MLTWQKSIIFLSGRISLISPSICRQFGHFLTIPGFTRPHNRWEESTRPCMHTKHTHTHTMVSESQTAIASVLMAKDYSPRICITLCLTMPHGNCYLNTSTTNLRMFVSFFWLYSLVSYVDHEWGTCHHVFSDISTYSIISNQRISQAVQ